MQNLATNSRINNIELNLTAGLLIIFYINFIIPFTSYKALFYIFLLVPLYLFSTNKITPPRLSESLYYNAITYTIAVLIAACILSGIFFGLHKKNIQNLIFSIVALSAFLFLFQNRSSYFNEKYIPSIIVIFFISTLYHIYGSYISGKFAFFSNPHYAAQFSITAISIFSLSILFFRNKLIIALILLSLSLNTWLLIETLSRPAWLALLLSTISFVFLFKNGTKKFISFSAIITFSFAAYFLLPEFFSNRIDNLIIKLRSEERVEIWNTTVQMLFSQDFIYWLTGHGLGSFTPDVQEFTSSSFKYLFPHNFVLELLYETGIIGLSLVAYLYYIIYKEILFISFIKDKNRRYVRNTGRFLYFVLTVNLLHAFITFPFFSKYVLLYQIPFVALAAYLAHSERTRYLSADQNSH